MIVGNEKKPREWRDGYKVGYQALKSIILFNISKMSDTKKLLDKAEMRFGSSWTRDDEGFITDANQNLRYAYTEGYQAALKDLRDKLLKEEER